MADRNVVGIGENEPGDTVVRNFACSSTMGSIGVKMSAKTSETFFQITAKTGGRTNLVIKFRPLEQTRFVAEEKRRMVHQVLDGFRADASARGDSPSRNAVIEIHQHLPEIKNNDFRFGASLRGVRGFVGVSLTSSSLHFTPSLESPIESQLVGKFEAASHRKAVGDANPHFGRRNVSPGKSRWHRPPHRWPKPKSVRESARWSNAPPALRSANLPAQFRSRARGDLRAHDIVLETSRISPG